MYLGKNNLHGKAVLQKLHVNRLESDETTRVTKDFIWNNKNSKIGYFMVFDACNILNSCGCNVINYLSFLEKQKSVSVKNLYMVLIRNLEQALNYWLKL